MIYGYARVSSAGQAIDGNSLEAQSELLKPTAHRKSFRMFTPERSCIDLNLTS